MDIKKIHFAYFTPTQLTRRYIYCVVAGMGNGIPTQQYNLTNIADRKYQNALEKDELLVVALPSFSGRIPRTVPPLLRNFWGYDSPAVVITTYGNHSYGDILPEIQQVLKEQGFVTIAGAALVSQHALSSKIGTGRPDKNDLAAARSFGKKVIEKVHTAAEPLVPIQFPGNLPTGEPPSPYTFTPITAENCVLCMQCFRWCPVGAIEYNNPNKTDVSKCILCHACVSLCPVGARKVIHPPFLEKIEQLENECANNNCQAEMFF